MTKKKIQCPKCKSRNIAVIVYGYIPVSESFSNDLKEGKVVLGGCCIGDDDPTWHCNECHYEFGNRFKTLEELKEG